MNELRDKLMIITANIMALIVALYAGNISYLLLFYWIENGVLGLFNFLRMIVCGQNREAKLLYIPVFFVMYNAFMFGYFLLLVLLLKIIGENNVMTVSGISTIIIGVVVLLLTHGARFVGDETNGELKSTGPEKYIMQPYFRIIVMHLTVISGTLVYFKLDKPFYIILLIIALKTSVELYFENEHTPNSTIQKI